MVADHDGRRKRLTECVNLASSGGVSKSRTVKRNRAFVTMLWPFARIIMFELPPDSPCRTLLGLPPGL
eukprot:2884962-Amphidinium_carterae.1